MSEPDPMMAQAAARMRRRSWLFGALAAAALFLPATASAQGVWASVLELIQKLGQEMSAIAVATKQTAVSANVVSRTVVTSKMQLANAKGMQDMNARLLHAFEEYNVDVGGQPQTILCPAQQESRVATLTQAQSVVDRGTLMRSYAGQQGGSLVAAEAAKWKMHKDNYCTVSEAKQGVCTLSPNGMQGWDTNYGAAFADKTSSPEVELATYAYAAMLSDERADLAVGCSSVACAASMQAQLESASISSMVAAAIVGQATDRRVSLAGVQTQ